MPITIRRLWGRLRDRIVRPDDFASRLGVGPSPTGDPCAGEAGAALHVLNRVAAEPRSRPHFRAGNAAYFRRGLPVGDHVDTAFGMKLGRRPRRVYEARRDLRGAFPYGLLPTQRRLYAAWLFDHGRTELELTDVEIWWYLSELACDPGHGIAETFALTPGWQRAVPHGLTVFGHDDLKTWLAREHGLNEPWVRGAALPSCCGPWDEVRLLWRARPELADPAAERAARDGDPEPLLAGLRRHHRPERRWVARLRREIATGVAAKPAANLIGYFRYPSGLQVEVAGNVVGLERAGSRTCSRDIPMAFGCDWSEAERHRDPELFDVSLVKSGAFEPLAEGFERSGFHPHPAVYRVAMWSWELELFPASLLERAELADEFWGPTEFVAEAIRRAEPGRPVRAMFPGLEVPEVAPLPKAHFGLDPSKFLFFFMFDLSSVGERKNPRGLIEAYRRAFPGREASLAIKVSRGESWPDELAVLREMAAGAGVTLIERLMPRGEVLGLLAASDAYVSLHRSEGVGLTLAEAMLYGKPVIATGYSGNLEFMNADVSLLVDYELVPLGRDIGPYPKEAFWAEPSVEHAARLMRRVFDDRGFARDIGAKAAAHARAVLSLEAAGRRMVDRIAQIREGRRR